MLEITQDTKKERQLKVKQLVEKYPFLLPRNIFTDRLPDDYDYTYIKYLEIPKGWNKLFLQLCEDIRQPLIDEGYLDSFRLTQVKEKFNELRVYHAGASDAVEDIIRKYEVMAKYICSHCGKPAEYETCEGYIESFCANCRKELLNRNCKSIKPIIFEDSFVLTQYDKTLKKTETKISFRDEWERYIIKIQKH
jgi:hypothetical protein